MITQRIKLLLLLIFFLLGQLQAQKLRALQPDSSTTCLNQGEVYDLENLNCISKSDCTKYLVEDKTCTSTCPLGYFPHLDALTPYIPCTSSCQSPQLETIVQPSHCPDNCALPYELNSQKYCGGVGGCPSQLPYLYQTNKGQGCKSQCENNQVVYESLGMKVCYDIANCPFVVDQKKCQVSCPSNYYISKKIQGTNYQSCSLTCKILIKDDSDDRYYCQESCNGSLFKTRDASGNSISYCDSCPSKLPIKSIINENTHICSQCKSNQLFDYSTNTCLEQQDCQGYIIDGVSCNKTCPSPMFTYPTFQLYKRCDTRCDSNYLTSPDDKKCYATSSECPQLVSSDGKQCVSSCIRGELQEVKNGIQQCFVCKEYPLNNGCVNSCPQSFKYSMLAYSCVNNCTRTEFLSSDQTLCLLACSWNFEVRDQNTNNCKKCNPDELFVFIDLKGKCIKNDNSDDTIAKFKQSLFDTFEWTTFISLLFPKTQKTIQSQILDFQSKVEKRLNEIANKQTKTDDDLEKANFLFSQVLDLTKQQLISADPTTLNKPIQICNSSFNTISQAYQIEKTFAISFDYESIQNCQIADLQQEITDSTSDIFIPQFLSVSYIKNNHFCRGDDCKNTSSLITVSYQTQVTNRMVTSNAQQFNVVYTIPTGQDQKKQACLNYDINGVATLTEGKIEGNKITCKFTSSSGLMYDQTCKFIDSSICDRGKTPEKPNEPEKPENLTENQSNQTEKLKGEEIAGIVIGVVAGLILLGAGFLCYLRNKKKAKKYQDEVKQHKAIDTEECNINSNDQQTESQQQTPSVN